MLRGGALSSSSRLCFLQTKNRRGDLHASRHSINVRVLVLLSASHCGCHSDFPKAILICGGCSKCALLPRGCPCAAHCHSAWLCCRRCKCLLCWQREEQSQVKHFWLRVSFAWELKTFLCPCHLKFLLLKISHYLFLYLCNAGGFNLKCLNSLYFKDTLTRTNINFLINCLLKVIITWFGPLEARM